MKMFRLAVAGILPAFVLLVCIQLNARAASTASRDMQSWFSGDETVSRHIWQPVGTLYNDVTYATAKVGDGFSLRPLLFADRVAYQRAIEEVYWRHRIWPRGGGERPDPKPSLDAVMSQATIEEKVQDYLRHSELLEEEWQKPITPEQLQAEMERMAQHSKQPEVLRELFAALGNDPFVIAECLARPVLTEQLIVDLSGQHQTGRLESLRTAETQTPKKVAAIETRSLPSSLAAAHRGFTFYLADPSARLNSIAKAVQVNRPYQLPAIASPSGTCIDDTWPATTIDAPPGRGNIQATSGVGPGSSSERSAAGKRISTRPVEFSASRQCVSGHEIAGFTARQELRAQAENLAPPAGLKPVEQEAWLAMAHRQGADGGTQFFSFYPARYNEPFVVESRGVRVAVRPVGGTDVKAQIDNGQVIYRQAYPGTDSVHAVSSGRSEEFLFLQDECAPREFEYELSELSAETRVELVKGEVRVSNKAGQGVKIEAPRLIEATGKRRADAVRWELEESKSGALPRLRLVVAKGLSYPVLIDPRWVTTGRMSTGRAYHTATLLPSGKVLVAGGFNGNGAVSSAELYDPASGSWSNTGNLITAREQHTATLLPSGQVLVAGGDSCCPVLFESRSAAWGGGSNFLSSAELYDPASGTWTATGSLVTARFRHTATLLPSGQVLVAGGADRDSLSSAELYDPASGTWTATGSLVTARTQHTATLLSSGQVLVAGGFNFDDGALSSAELYDPASGTWTATGSLVNARHRHTATLLPSGQVLVAGGGGDSPSVVLTSAELYDPASGNWTATGSLVTARFRHTATLLPSGQVLVAGGLNFDDGVLSSTELYDPASGTWTATGSLVTARHAHTATLLPSGKVLVAVGLNGGYLHSAELYDPASGSWSNTASLGTARSQHTATLLPSGQVLVAGGAGSSGYLRSAELYNPATGNWTATGILVTARSEHTATLLPSGKVLVAGGYNSINHYLSSAELYDPASGTWTATGSMDIARDRHTATLLPSGKVLVAGGDEEGASSQSAELYDPVTGTWTATGYLRDGREWHTATLLPSGKVLVAGGYDFLPNIVRNSAELYDPATGTWTVTGYMGNNRAYHTATLLPSGKVLAAGGYNVVYPIISILSSAELYDPATETWITTGSMSHARVHHTATLLPSGQELVAGGNDESRALASTDLYDPASGTWMATRSMHSRRSIHTATLLPSGTVLVAGGGNLGSAELYDQGLGFDPAWQPLLTLVTPLIGQGSELTASGSHFQGISEASGGSGYQNSSSNHPLVHLLNLANEQTLFLPVDAMTGWSDTSFTSTPITLMTTTSSGFPIGYALVTVFTNGIPSQSQFVLAATSSPMLHAKKKRIQGINTVRLQSSGATSTNVDVYRNNVLIATQPNDGQYDDSTGDTGRAHYTYQVCEAGTQICSNEATVTFPQ